MVDVKIFDNNDALYHAAAEDFMRRSIQAVNEKGRFLVVLAGGNTPISYFDTLAQEPYKTQIPWAKVNFFFSDERYVPADDNKNNYHMAYKHLFSKLSIPNNHIFRIPTEANDPKVDAKKYEDTLRNFFKLNMKDYPEFDLFYLGLGEDGHTASLMPHSDVVMTYCDNTDASNDMQLVAAIWVPELNMYRITLTPPLINNSACISFMVTGLNKASALWHVLEGPRDPAEYPAQLIHAHSGVNIWYLDKTAAQKILGQALE